MNFALFFISQSPEHENMKSMVAFCLRVTLFPATKVHTYLGDEDGTQIDSRDRVVNNCEMKSSSEPFVIDEDYDMKERFTEVTGTMKSILIAFITTYGVRKNMYSGMISNQVKLEDLFAKETFKREDSTPGYPKKRGSSSLPHLAQCGFLLISDSRPSAVD